jgi:hypothetical protein
LEIASERVRAFLSAILAREKEQQKHTPPAHRKQQALEHSGRITTAYDKSKPAGHVPADRSQIAAFHS